jgi:hypothetical protein
MFFFRTLTRITGEGQPLLQGGSGVFLGNLRNSLLMFNGNGDRGWFASVPNDPLLDPLSGSLFVLGLAMLGWRLVRFHDLRAVYLGAALLILLMPSTLALAFPNENPSASRSSAALPVVATIVALPFGSLLRRCRGSVQRALLAGLLTTAGTVAVATNYRSYFVDYAQSYRASVPNASEIARAAAGFAASIGDLEHVYLVSWPNWVDHRMVGLLAGDLTWNNLLDDVDGARRHALDPEAKLYILNVADKRSLEQLRDIFPSGHVQHRTSAVGKDFVLFVVPGTAS